MFRFDVHIGQERKKKKKEQANVLDEFTELGKRY
jgi:hypothetical protein